MHISSLVSDMRSEKVSLSLSISALTWETLSEGEEGDEGRATGLREGSLGDDPLV